MAKFSLIYEYVPSSQSLNNSLLLYEGSESYPFVYQLAKDQFVILECMFYLNFTHVRSFK